MLRRARSSCSSASGTTGRALSAVLRIVPSEFQEFRIQFKGTRRNEQAALRFDDQDEDHEIFFEWIPAIGAHAAHPY